MSWIPLHYFSHIKISTLKRKKYKHKYTYIQSKVIFVLFTLEKRMVEIKGNYIWIQNGYFGVFFFID